MNTYTRPIKILIEGPDFSGKTTVAENIAKKFSIENFHCPKGKSEETINLYEKIKTTHCESSKLLYLLSTHKLNCEYINSAYPGIVVDRGFLSLFVYQNFENINDFFDSLFSAGVQNVDYDLIIFLDADDDELLKRAAVRSDNDSLDDFFFKKIKKITKKYRENYNKLYPPERCVHIDTTHNTPEETLEIVYSHVFQLFR